MRRILRPGGYAKLRVLDEGENIVIWTEENHIFIEKIYDDGDIVFILETEKGGDKIRILHICSGYDFWVKRSQLEPIDEKKVPQEYRIKLEGEWIKRS